MYITGYSDYNPHERNNDIRALAIESLFSSEPKEDLEFIQLKYRSKRTSIVRPTKYEFGINQKYDQYIAKAKVTFKHMDRRIAEFLETHTKDIEKYYTLFRIPKASGGTRKITAPENDLKELQTSLLGSFKSMRILEHDAAFAYVEKRSTVDALTVHQANKSQWFLKLDLTKFFPSFTKEVITETLNRLYPIQFIDDELIEHVVEVGLYEGGLPQGSPLSPLLSNLCMVPFDHKLSKKLWDHNKQHFVYTRYADDIIISSQYDFNFNHIISLVQETLSKSGLPHEINHKKTRYGSRSGSNWNLGLMLNKDNNITLGYKKKQSLKAMLHCFLADTVDQNYWELLETQEFLGKLNYAKQVEPSYWEKRILMSEEKNNITLAKAQEIHYSLN